MRCTPNRRWVTLAAAALIGAPPNQATARARSRGRFVGRLVTEWLEDSDRMRLTRPFAYVDLSGKWWQVPAGAVIDGASIPRALWPIVGHPFRHPYRKASVVHDWYCDVRVEPWQRVHRAFLEAMLDAGVDERKAHAMYVAVYVKGPRWDPQVVANNRLVLSQAMFLDCPEVGRGTYACPAAARAAQPASQNAVPANVNNNAPGGLPAAGPRDPWTAGPLSPTSPIHAPPAPGPGAFPGAAPAVNKGPEQVLLRIERGDITPPAVQDDALLSLLRTVQAKPLAVAEIEQIADQLTRSP